MFVLIAGGGRTGAQLATFLVSQKHEVRLIEHRPEILAHIHRELPTEVVFHGNATDPDVLERAGAATAQVLAACMRGDADNLPTVDGERDDPFTGRVPVEPPRELLVGKLRRADAREQRH